jgi:hypothetical protein
MARKKIAFGWYGGKYSHLDWLLPLLPQAHHYCEPFGGSAAVLLTGYHCELMDRLYEDWFVYEAPPKKVHSVKTERVEVLWTNYSSAVSNKK